jgi:hypothetical protein
MDDKGVGFLRELPADVAGEEEPPHADATPNA